MPSTFSKRILFRVEGNDVVGHGHFMRCLTIARYLQNDFDCVFAMSSVSDWVISQLMEHNLSVIDLPYREQYHPDDPRSNQPWYCDVVGILQPSDVMILDGYRFDSSFYKAAQHIGSKTICIVDDLGRRVDCDAIITQLPIAHSKVQLKLGIGNAWTGLDGFLVRPEFYAAHPMTVPICYDFFIYVTTAAALNFYCQHSALAGKSVLAITTNVFFNQCHDSGWEVALQLSAEEMALKMKESENAILPASSIAVEYYIATGKSPFVNSFAQNQNLAFDLFTGMQLFIDAALMNQSESSLQCQSSSDTSFPSLNLVNWFNGQF